MADLNRIQSNMEFYGEVKLLNAAIYNACIGDTQVKSTDPISADKIEHEHRAGYAQESATTAADEARVLHVVMGATGTLRAFKAGVVVACVGDSEIEIDLLKDGVTVLTAPITITSAHAAYEIVVATISSASVVAGDVLEVSIDATVGTGTLGKGVFATLDLAEDVES